jgi:hypothetical protein
MPQVLPEKLDPLKNMSKINDEIEESEELDNVFPFEEVTDSAAYVRELRKNAWRAQETSGAKKLPIDRQQEVVDFIAFLKERVGIKGAPSPVLKKKAAADGFVGMWTDREDMNDSSLWVRQMRADEWESREKP